MLSPFCGSCASLWLPPPAVVLPDLDHRGQDVALACGFACGEGNRLGADEASPNRAPATLILGRELQQLGLESRLWLEGHRAGQSRGSQLLCPRHNQPRLDAGSLREARCQVSRIWLRCRHVVAWPTVAVVLSPDRTAHPAKLGVASEHRDELGNGRCEEYRQLHD